MLVATVVGGILWPGGLLRHDVAPAPAPEPTTTTTSPAKSTTTAVTGARTTAGRPRPHATTTDRSEHLHDREPVTRNERLRARFVAEHPFPLDDFQRRALDVLDDGRSVLVAAPTGAGKTLDRRVRDRGRARERAARPSTRRR